MLNKTLLFYLSISLLIPMAIAFGVGLKNYKKSKNSTKRIVEFLGFAICFQCFGLITTKLGFNNQLAHHLYIVVEFVFISLFYFEILSDKEESKGKRSLKWLLVFSFFIALIGLSLMEGLNNAPFYTKPLECVVLTMFSIIFYIKEIKSLDKITTSNLNTEGDLIINSGILVYFSGVFFIYSIQNIVTVQLDIDQYVILRSFNIVLNFIFYIIILIGLWKLLSQNKTSFG